jgi:hypothetical protein
MANGQSSLPKLEPEVARELFSVYAACRAYWKAIIQCVPSGLEPNDSAKIRKTYDQLQWVGIEHMKFLAERAQLSPGMQQQITDSASCRVSEAAGNKCANAPSLIKTHRDKCAALFENITTAQTEIPSTDQPTAAEITESATKFITSTCYKQIDDISRVSSYAQEMKWNALSANQKNVMKPVESTFYNALAVDHDGFTYFVSISRGRLKGRPQRFAKSAFPNVRSRSFHALQQR